MKWSQAMWCHEGPCRTVPCPPLAHVVMARPPGRTGAARGLPRALRLSSHGPWLSDLSEAPAPSLLRRAWPAGRGWGALVVRAEGFRLLGAA